MEQNCDIGDIGVKKKYLTPHFRYSKMAKVEYWYEI